MRNMNVKKKDFFVSDFGKGRAFIGIFSLKGKRRLFNK